MDTSVRVLLVDDEPGIRHVLGALIRDFGYDVHTAESAREALEAFTANPFPIVVTDIRMPGMDGLELVERAMALLKEKKLPFGREKFNVSIPRRRSVFRRGIVLFRPTQ